MFRYLDDEFFCQRLAAEEYKLLRNTGQQLTNVSLEAMQTLSEIMRNAAKDADRRLAASSLLIHLMRFRELDLEERLTRLEERIYSETTD